MAQASRLSRSAVHRIWRAFALQPHRTETFKLSADPLFIVVLPPASGKHRDRLQRVKDCHLNRRQLIIIDGIIKLRAV